MRRADRLFQIVQILRRGRQPITAGAIADELETSKRTVYRAAQVPSGHRPSRAERWIPPQASTVSGASTKPFQVAI